MRKPSRKHRRRQHADDVPPGSGWWFWPGAVLLLIVLVGIGASLEGLSWQLLTMLRYTRGSCRVVAAEIVPMANTYELRIAHEVLLPTGVTGRNENTEQHTPSYNNRVDAEASLAHYAIGTVHPCWYDADNPARYSVLVRRGIDPTVQFIVLGVSMLIGWVGLSMVRRASGM
ncbi:MAG: hypothetical protein JNM18_08855 [Planctomycetaceae bacterium]|nr:hypothetical protein [Planctomycetaceae bacterium]